MTKRREMIKIEVARMTIPEVRDRLRELAVIHRLPELDVLAQHMMRRDKGTRSMTRRLRSEITEYHTKYPNASHQHIANVFKVNSGRISECLSANGSGEFDAATAG
jgi:ribose 1,5-bisphosphokinase PhnN